MPDGYRLFVSKDRTVLVRIWTERPEVVEVCTREDPDGIWSPPVTVKEEK